MDEATEGSERGASLNGHRWIKRETTQKHRVVYMVL